MPLPITSDAVAIYRMDESNDTDDAIDATTNGNDAPRVGTPTPVIGKFAGAREQEAATIEGFKIPTASAGPFLLQDFSILFWCSLINFAGRALYRIDRSGGAGNFSVNVSYDGSGNLFAQLTMSDLGFVSAVSSAKLVVDTFTHVAITYGSVTDPVLRLYHQGIEVANDTPPGALDVLYSGGVVADVGIGVNTATGIERLIGRLDDFGVYDTVKSPSFIQQAFNDDFTSDATVKPVGPFWKWRFT